MMAEHTPQQRSRSIREIYPRTYRVYRKIHLFFGVLDIVRFSLLIPAALGLAMLSDQFTDLLRALTESDVPLADNPHATHRLAVVLGVLFCSLVVWHSARTMFRFRFTDREASQATVHPGLKKWLPRLLAVSVPALLAWRIAVLAAGNADPAGARRFAVYLALEAVLIGLFVWQRRALASWQLKGNLRPLRVLASVGEEKRDLTTLDDFRTQAPATARLVGTLLLANVIAMLVFIFAPPLWLGAMAILLLGLGLLSAAGTVVTYFANRARIPLLTLLMIWAVTISAFNDNHLVRPYAGAHSHAVVTQAPPPTAHGTPLPDASLGGYFERWWTDLDKTTPGMAPIPVLVVSAEGGGIRAAYWTAQVLGHLQDEAPSFARHVFAISGVSGGSLGGATFAASVRAHRDRATSTSYQREAHDMLSADFLSAPLGSMLFPDLFQRFWPWPAFDDRAIALEKAWERQWQVAHQKQSNLFAQPFLSLWDGEHFDVPLLFLNSTVVETGERAIVSPLAPAAATGAQSPFADAQSLTGLLGTDYALSTAVHLSARFTYVSPAGLVRARLDANHPQASFVDGGYFDNSGDVTAQEIVHAIESAHRKAGFSRALHIVLLHIPNEPPNKTPDSSWLTRFLNSHTLLNESMSPINALMATREARGIQARQLLCRELASKTADAAPPDCAAPISPAVDQGQSTMHLYFTLYQSTSTLPLGWALSKQAQDDMSRQMETCDQHVPKGCAAEQKAKVLAALGDL